MHLAQPVQLSNGSHIFVHAPQYHWHVAIAKGAIVVDKEVGEGIFSIVGLLDHFGHRIEQREAELWAHAERAAYGSHVVHLWNPWMSTLLGWN